MRSQRRLVRPNNIVIESPFIITVKTDNSGSTATNQFEIPTRTTGNNFNVKTSDGQTYTGLSGNPIITFPVAGTYDLEITGDLQRIHFNRGFYGAGGDLKKILDIKQWGDIVWTTFYEAFHSCNNLGISATDAPNLSICDSFYNAFANCRGQMNGDFSNWNVSGIQTFESIFLGAYNFNGNISNWDVSGVSNNADFRNALRQTNFNGDISNWNMSNAKNLLQCFQLDPSFNSDVSDWDVSNLLYADRAFSELPSTYPHLDDIYNNWSQLILKPNVNIHFGSAKYTSAGQAGRNILTGTFGWGITDGGLI